MILPYRLASRLFHLLPLPPGKLAKSRAGRLAATARWIQWARDSRTNHPLVWFHAASVGETQVIAPLVTLFRARFPSLQSILTYSSPSMAAWPHNIGVDHEDFAPAELSDATKRVFDTLRPALIVVSRGDLWPEMVHTARVKGVPVAVVGGMVRQGSARLPWLARTIMKGLYRDLAFVGAVSHEDALRWIQLGTSRHAVKVTGDPRSDYVLERSPNHQVLQPFEAWASAGPVMVAGSTDRRDEEVLIDACAEVRSNHGAARLMIVPHEPSREGTERLRARARSLGLEVALWSRSTANDAPPVVVVDAVGILADLYALGTLAYVGGGFGTAGIHSLLEPASFAIPVLAGPGAMDDAAARAFVESGGVVVVEGAMPAETLAARWTALLGDADLRTSAGRAARAQITRGAAEESMKGLERLLADVDSREERARV